MGSSIERLLPLSMLQRRGNHRSERARFGQFHWHSSHRQGWHETMLAEHGWLQQEGAAGICLVLRQFCHARGASQLRSRRAVANGCVHLVQVDTSACVVITKMQPEKL